MTMTLIAFDPVAQGSAYLAALEAAGIAHALRPDGLHVGDASAALALDTDAAMLPFARALKLEALAAEYAARIAAGRGYTVPGGSTNTYQIDDVSPSPGRPSSQEQIAKVAQQADRAIRNGVTGTPWDPAVTIPFFFQDAANTQVPMTAQEAYDFATAMGQYCTGLVLRSLQLKSQIGAAASVAAVNAVDIAAGWPV